MKNRIGHDFIDPARLEYVTRYSSDPMHYSTLQRGLSYDDSERGFVAYQSVLLHKIALATPVTETPFNNMLMLWHEFIRKHPQVILCNLNERAAREVHDQGLRYEFVRMGSEYIVNTQMLCSETSTARSKLARGALKHARRYDFRLEEFVPIQESEEMLKTLVKISNTYVRKSKIGVEMRFTNRPLDIRRMKSARYFKLINLNGVFGLAVLDPYRSATTQNAFMLNIVRFSPTRQWGVYLSVIYKLSEILAQEGITELSLGLAPMDRKDMPKEFPQGNTLSKLVTHLYTKRYELFVSKALEKQKMDMAEIAIPRYLAIRTKSPLLGFIALLKAMDVPLVKTALKLAF